MASASGKIYSTLRGLYRRSNKSIYTVIINSISINSHVIYRSFNALMCLQDDILTCFFSESTVFGLIKLRKSHTYLYREKKHTLSKEMQNEVKNIINIQQVSERLKALHWYNTIILFEVTN